MSKLTFRYFMDYDNGKMARVETIGQNKIPVNIFIDNAADFADAQEGPCSVEICGVGSNIKVYASEDAYWAENPMMNCISLIPMGTFPAKPDDQNFRQSPHILFTGRALEVDWDSEAAQNEPNYCILVETLELEFSLYLRCSVPVEKGFLIHGIAWLYGDLELDAG